jgi:hypothetical protein
MTAKGLTFIISLLFSFLLFAQSEREIIATQVKEAQGIAAQWVEMKKNGIQKKDIFEGQVERADYIISGIPKYVKEVNPSGLIYRHYTGNHTAIILETNQLKTGITPYIIMNPGYSREVYEDLVGIFLTTPLTPPERVGLPRNSNADYIDFTLYEGTPVVEIEKEILLIPGRPDLPAWLKTLYQDYKATGRYDIHYLEIFKKADARGGVNPTFMKINIQSYRMNGKITYR